MTSKFTTPSTELFKPLPEPWVPHNYQKKGVKFLLENACALLLLDPGLGKTSIVLAAIKILLKKEMVGKILVIAPMRVCYNVWPKEAKKWTDFNHFTFEVLHGAKKDQALAREADIYLINPEGLDWLLKPTKTKTAKGRTSVAVDVRRFKAMGFTDLVVDELTKFKNHTSLRWKMLKQVLHTFHRRWGLTGSLGSNGLEQLFGEVYIVDLGRSLGSYITQYRNDFFVVDYSGFGYRPIEGAEDLIYRRLAPISLRMADTDYLQMPKLIPNDIPVELPADARRIYDALEEDMIVELTEGKISASNLGVALGKCRQVASGGIFTDPKLDELGLRIKFQKREWVNIHDAKTEALVDLVDELHGEPVLVAYEFQHDRARIEKAFPKAVFVSDYTAAEFSGIEDAWNNGEIDFLASHPVSLAHGLNLQRRGHHVIWYTLTWDYEIYDQFIRRIYRQGNKNSRIFVHRLIVENTIEKLVAVALTKKKKGQKILYDGLVKYADGRRNRRRTVTH